MGKKESGRCNVVIVGGSVVGKLALSDSIINSDYMHVCGLLSMYMYVHMSSEFKDEYRVD